MRNQLSVLLSMFLVVAACDETAASATGAPSLPSSANEPSTTSKDAAVDIDASSSSPQEVEPSGSEEPEFHLSENIRELIGMPYGEARGWLLENGWTKDTETESWHTVADDPADCGNRGCTVFWRDSHGARACVGVDYDERLEEKDREVTNIRACD
jgi:hypothetical protein